MSAVPLLRTLFQYQAWANAEFIEKLEGLAPNTREEQRGVAIRLLNHCLVVNQIFAAHITGSPHGFQADNTPELPSLKELGLALAATDRWYLEYLEAVTPELLSEAVPFRFTDGDKGCMSRQEMLLHVVTHNGYHRGEVGRIMTQSAVPVPWDTFAVYLHRLQPERRLA